MWTWKTTCLRLMTVDKRRSEREMKEGQTRAEDRGFKLIYVKYWKR